MKTMWCENCEFNAREAEKWKSVHNYSKMILDKVQDYPGVREKLTAELRQNWRGKNEKDWLGFKCIIDEDKCGKCKAGNKNMIYLCYKHHNELKTLIFKTVGDWVHDELER